MVKTNTSKRTLLSSFVSSTSTGKKAPTAAAASVDGVSLQTATIAATSSASTSSLLSSSSCKGFVVGMGDVLASLSLNDSDDEKDVKNNITGKKTTNNRNRTMRTSKGTTGTSTGTSTTNTSAATTTTATTRTVRPSRNNEQQHQQQQHQQQHRGRKSAALNNTATSASASATTTTTGTTSTTSTKTNRKPMIRRRVILDDTDDDDDDSNVDDEEEEGEKENHRHHSPPQSHMKDSGDNDDSEANSSNDDESDSKGTDDDSEEEQEEEGSSDGSVVGEERSTSDGADAASYDNDDDSNENDDDIDEVDESDSIIDEDDVDEDNDSEEALDDSSFELDGSSNNQDNDDSANDEDDADISDVSYLDPDADEIRPLSLIQKQQQRENQQNMTPIQTTPTPKLKMTQLIKQQPQQQPNQNRSKPFTNTARTNSTLNRQIASSSKQQQQQHQSIPTTTKQSRGSKNHEAVKGRGGRKETKSSADIVVQVEVELDDDPNNEIVHVDTDDDDDDDEVIAEIVSDSSCCSSRNDNNDCNVDIDADHDDNLDGTINDINNTDNDTSNDCDNFVIDDDHNQSDPMEKINNKNNNNNDDNNDVFIHDHDAAPIEGETKYIDTNRRSDIATTSDRNSNSGGSTCARNDNHNSVHHSQTFTLSSTSVALSPSAGKAGLVTTKDDDSIPHNIFDSSFIIKTSAQRHNIVEVVNDHSGHVNNNDAAVVVAAAVASTANSDTNNETVQEQQPKINRPASAGDDNVVIRSSTCATVNTSPEKTNEDNHDTTQQVQLRRWNDIDKTGSKESTGFVQTIKIATDHKTNPKNKVENTTTVPTSVTVAALRVTPFTLATPPPQQKKPITTIISENPPVVPVSVIDMIRQDDDVFSSATPTTPPPAQEKASTTTSTSTTARTATHVPTSQLQDHAESINDEKRSKVKLYPDMESKSESSGTLLRRECSIKRGQWKLGSKIGVGAFGVVHIGMNTMNGMLMAVKSIQIPMVGSGSNSIMRDAEIEIQLLKSLHHDNIVRYLGAEMDKNYLHIFQEWVPAGSITTMLLKFGPFPILVIQNYVLQILQGLDYLHSNHIMHRDIKGSNVLVTDDGVVKLADFGSSKRFKQLKQDMMMSLTMRGTPYFMAPEVFEEKYSTKADIWSVGCVAVQMTTGNPPWKNLGLSNPVSLFQHISKTTGPPQISCTASEEPSSNTRHDVNIKLDLFKKMINLCFDRKPENRPSAKELIDHAFFLLDDQNVSMDDTSDSVIGQSFRSPSSEVKRTFKHTTISSSPIWANNLSPVNRRAPMRRCNSGGCAIRSPMFSPPLPKRSNENNINRMDGDRLSEYVGMKPELSPIISSPAPNESEWPTWAKKKLLDTTYKEKFDGRSVSSLLCNESPQEQHIGEKSEMMIEPTSRSILAMTADSLAYSDDDDDNENNKNSINNSRSKEGKQSRLQDDIFSPPLIGVQISTPPF